MGGTTTQTAVSYPLLGRDADVTPAEPDGFDLQRQVDRIRQDLADANARGERHVSTESLAAILARYDDQLKAGAEDIAQERGMRVADITALRDWAKTEFERVEKRQKEADDKAKEQDRERRADRRVIYAAIAAAVSSLLYDIFTRSQGIG